MTRETAEAVVLYSSRFTKNDTSDRQNFTDGKLDRETQKYGLLDGQTFSSSCHATIGTSITMYTDFFYVLFIIRDS